MRHRPYLIPPAEIAAVMMAHQWIDIVPGSLRIDCGAFLAQCKGGEWITGPVDTVQASRTAPRRVSGSTSSTTAVVGEDFTAYASHETRSAFRAAMDRGTL